MLGLYRHITKLQHLYCQSATKKGIIFCTYFLFSLSTDNPDAFAVRVQVQKDRDVLSTSWLADCVQQGRKIVPHPRHFIHLSRTMVGTYIFYDQPLQLTLEVSYAVKEACTAYDREFIDKTYNGFIHAGVRTWKRVW